MNKKCINIACGEVYVGGWMNLDYSPHSSGVMRANILNRLPVDDTTADVVYSSHFFEHIPRKMVTHFVGECFRILKSGAYLRLVMPDFEELCRCYLTSRENGEHGKADFLVLEMLDQCVRTTAGGELGAYYRHLQLPDGAHDEMIEFVRQRTGHELRKATVAVPDATSKRLAKIPARLRGRLERFYCNAILALLPSAFRQQNVSLAGVGERHAWIYDFYSVQQLLTQAGFINVRRATATDSGIDDFPFVPLDVTSEGRPRKGFESMYIEAVKP